MTNAGRPVVRAPTVPMGALTASLLAHLTLAVALLTARSARLPVDPPPVSIEVVAATADAPVADTPAVASQPGPATPAAPDPATVPVPAVDAAPPRAADDTEPEPATPSTSAPEAATVPAPEAAVAVAAAPRPLPPRPLPERPGFRHKPARHSTPAPVEPAAPAPTAPTTLASAAAPTAQVVAAPSPARSIPDPTWQSELAAWLATHKHYPEDARAHSQQGAVGVAFTVARDGRVEAVRIDRPSGVAALDRSVVEMLENKRVPPFSLGMAGEQTLVRVTIRFELDY